MIARKKRATIPLPLYTRYTWEAGGTGDWVRIGVRVTRHLASQIFLTTGKQLNAGKENLSNTICVIYSRPNPKRMVIQYLFASHHVNT